MFQLTRPSAQAAMSLTLVLMVLFSGFTVQPDVIPSYYIWIYWMNLYAWVIRAVVINEFQSGSYDAIVSQDGTTLGEAILERFGFVIKGEAFEYVWVWYTVLFCVGLCLLSMAGSVWALNHVREFMDSLDDPLGCCILTFPPSSQDLPLVDHWEGMKRQRRIPAMTLLQMVVA